MKKIKDRTTPPEEAKIDKPEDAGSGAIDGAEEEQPPALFATIHWKGPLRPNGYTPEEVAELNRIANLPRKPKQP